MVEAVSVAEAVEVATWLSSRVRWRLQTIPSPSEQAEQAARQVRREVLGLNQDSLLLESIYEVLEAVEVRQTGWGLVVETEGVAAVGLRERRVLAALLELALRLE